jgi:ABC-type transport system involved in cytochrome c biogenesis ATPase subunit
MGKPMVSAQALRFGQPGLLLWDGASHGWPAGLCLVRGGEGSGKTSLLQVLAGQLPLQGGRLDRPPAAFWRDPRAELGQAERALPVQEWVQAQRQLHPAWSEAVWQLHANGLGLEPHLHKPLLALSTGSLRKLWMAAGWASGAPLLLIDEPLAALDRGSMDHVQRTLAALNREGQQAAPVAGHGPRCVIVAHWDAMQGVAWDDVLDLPDQPPLR